MRGTFCIVAGICAFLGASQALADSIQAQVPNVVGMAQAAAETTLLAEGLTVGTVTTQNSNTVAAGNVLSQSQAAGASVALNTAVDLVVSLGPP